MEPLFAQLGRLPQRLGALPLATRILLGVVVLAGALAVAGASMLARGGGDWQYVFTNLSNEDGGAAMQQLKLAGIPGRLEAGGAALAVPADKVYEARLLLATAGLPRAGGVGFELFDKGELGVSEFTQRINLRRAIEGELARTIGRLAEVRSARVHLTLPEKSLFRDARRQRPTAAVVLTLQPGRTLDERQLAGVRHLVASAVPELEPSQITVVDGSGAILSVDPREADPASRLQRETERELEGRLVSLLEPAVGRGNVIARVTASYDASEVQSQAERVDPDQVAVKSERSITAGQQSQGAGNAGVVGAAANTPMGRGAQAAPAQGPSSAANSQDESKSYEISKTTTTTVQRAPRLARLSVAVLLSSSTARSEEELRRLGELAKRAVGFDARRGDELELSAMAFQPAEASIPEAAAATAEAAPEAAPAPVPVWKQYGPWGVAVLALLILAGVVLARRGSRAAEVPVNLLEPGRRVAELEVRLDGKAPSAEPSSLPNPLRPAALADPDQALRDKARSLAMADPQKAALLIRAWLLQKDEAHG